jgi:hypothetical protein
MQDRLLSARLGPFLDWDLSQVGQAPLIQAGSFPMQDRLSQPGWVSLHAGQAPLSQVGSFPRLGPFPGRTGSSHPGLVLSQAGQTPLSQAGCPYLQDRLLSARLGPFLDRTGSSQPGWVSLHAGQAPHNQVGSFPRGQTPLSQAGCPYMQNRLLSARLGTFLGRTGSSQPVWVPFPGRTGSSQPGWVLS